MFTRHSREAPGQGGMEVGLGLHFSIVKEEEAWVEARLRVWKG